jgi:hypothetical protein
MIILLIKSLVAYM